MPVYFEGALTQSGISLSGEPISLVQPHDETTEEQFAEASEASQILEQQSDLADIYLLPLTIEGGLVTGFEATSTRIPINLEAVNAAKVNGYDLRTYTNQLGIPVRLLTYVVISDQKAQVFQAGRFLYEQQRVLSQLMRTMVIAGALVTLFVGLLSWLMAGRTIKPSQEAWDKQLDFYRQCQPRTADPAYTNTRRS